MSKQSHSFILILHKLILNPSKQRASHVIGLEYISDLLSRCTLHEKAYRQRYEASSVSQVLDDNEQATVDRFKNELKKLCGQVLMFQARTVCRLSQHTLIGITRDMFMRDSWDDMLKEIKIQEANCEKLFEVVKYDVELESRE